MKDGEDAMGSGGAVAAGDARTAEAGAEALRAGGNAVDAACAACLMSFVVEPPLSSPGGAGVAVFGDVTSGFWALDFFSRVPGLGGRPGSLDFHAITVDFGETTQEFHVGRGAAAAPAAMWGVLELHRLGGQMPLTEVAAQAVELARRGFSFSPQVAWIVELLRPIVTLSPGVEALFCEAGAPATAGAKLRNPELAGFLEAFARDPTGTLRGPFAQSLLAGFGPGQGGLISAVDLETHDIVSRAPLRLPVGSRAEVLCLPPPSSGGTLIALALRLCEGLGLERGPFLGGGHLLAVAEIMRTVSAARAHGLDARIREPGGAGGLLSDEALERWRSAPPRPPPERSLGSTTHISVIDARGGAAAVTTSNGEGCGHAARGLGFQLNNFLGEEDINPGGFHLAAPGSKMTTMMAPTIVLRDGRPSLALGSGGSNRIRSAIFQALVATLIFGRDLDEAIAAARLHVEGDHLSFEDVDLQPEAVQGLVEAFPRHTRFCKPSMFFGGVHAVSASGGTVTAAADARRGGGAVVV